MKIIISTVISITTSIIFFLFGDIDLIIKCLLSMMILDYITGLIKGYINKEISSRASLKGILKKILYLIIVTASVTLDKILTLDYCIRDIVAYSFIFNEIISIIENCSMMGIKLPTILTSSLEVFNSKINKEKNNKDDKKTL